MQLQLGEIAPSLVAYLEPTILSVYGASCFARPEVWVEGIHPFVCVEEVEGRSDWVVLSSKAKVHRSIRISSEFKYGHPLWTTRDSFVYGHQHIWRGPNYAFQEASAADLSHPNRRNFVTDECVSLIRKSMRGYEGLVQAPPQVSNQIEPDGLRIAA